MDTYEREVLTQVYCKKQVEFLEKVEGKINEALDKANEICKDIANAKTIEDREYLECIFLQTMTSVKELKESLNEFYQ